MKHRIIVPITILIGALASYFAITKTADTLPVAANVDTLKKVDVETLRSEDYRVTLELHGFVQAQETTWLSSEVSGNITYIDDALIAGKVVKKGDLLVSIDSRSYQAKVLNAKATVMAAEAALAEEKALARVAQQEKERTPNKTYTDLFLRKPQLLVAQANLISARADLTQAQINLEKCDIRSPINGLVISREVGLGQVVSANTRLAQLDNIDIAEIVVSIPNFERKFLSEDLLGTKAQVFSFDGESHSGTVSRGLGIVDKDTRSSHLVVEIPSPYKEGATKSKFKFGDFVKVNLDSLILQSVYRVPQHLVNESKLWLVDEQARLKSRNVTVARKEGEYYFISNGLKDGEQYVVTLPEYPVDDLEVQIIEQGTTIASGKALGTFSNE